MTQRLVFAWRVCLPSDLYYKCKINSLMWRETLAVIYNLTDAKLRIEVTEVMFTTVKVAASCIRDLSLMALKVSTWYSCEISE